MVEAALTGLTNYEVSNQTGAGMHERNGDRLAYRSGYRDRTPQSCLGTLELSVPKLQPGTYFPSFLEPRRLFGGFAPEVIATYGDQKIAELLAEPVPGIPR